MDEKLIAKYMKSLEISREEAIELIHSDDEIDHMTSSKEINADLTDEQKKATKQARQADRKPTVYKFDTTKRKRAENTEKRGLIEILETSLRNALCQNIEVVNPEREIVFSVGETRYKIVLSQPRK